MKRTIAALALAGAALAGVPVAVGTPMAQAHPCSPEPVCHEFDWADPYLDAFERHGISYLVTEFGVPLMSEADWVCHGKPSRGDIRNVGGRGG